MPCRCSSEPSVWEFLARDWAVSKVPLAFIFPIICYIKAVQIVSLSVGAADEIPRCLSTIPNVSNLASFCPDLQAWQSGERPALAF